MLSLIHHIPNKVSTTGFRVTGFDSVKSVKRTVLNKINFFTYIIISQYLGVESNENICIQHL